MRPQAPRLPEFSFEKRQAVEGSSSTGSMLLESVPSPESQLIEGINMLTKVFVLVMCVA